MSFLGDLGGGLLDFLDPNAPAKEANKFEQERLAKILGIIDAERSNQGVQFGKAAALTRRALPITQKAFGDARANLALSADRQQRQLQQNEKSNMAQAQGQVFRAGGIGSNLPGLVSRGVRGDTTRASLALDDMFQRHFGQLGLAESDAVGQIYNRLAALKQGEAQGGLALTGMAANAQGGQNFYPSGGAGAWLDLIGQGAKVGAKLGGLFG